jgi:hypothetical protein
MARVGEVDLDALKQAVAAENAGWVPRDNVLLRLPEQQQRLRLGLQPDVGRLSWLRQQPQPDVGRLIAETTVRLQQPARTEKSPLLEVTAQAARAASALRREVEKLTEVAPWFLRWLFHVDWRDRFGLEAVSGVKDQGACGACVAFAAIATLESMLVIERNQTTDLSEAELLFCGGGSCQGWWPDNAIDYLGNRGVAQQECFRYEAHDMPCQTCSRRDGQAIKITRTTTLFDVEQRKDYLALVGPMIGAFSVYADFYAYSSGVYSQVTGEQLGGHCVEVIGYDDYLGCWICKNSWGTAWGERGFFRIAYGQCEIDSTYPFWGVSGTDWWS